MAPALCCAALVAPAAAGAPREDAHRGALRIASIGTRPAAGRAEGRAHASGVGVLMALAPRLRRVRPGCDV